MIPITSTPFPNLIAFKVPSAAEQALGKILWQYNDTQWKFESKAPYRPPVRPPFHVELEVDDANRFEFVVYLGYVYEVISDDPAQLIIHKPTNFETEPVLRFLTNDGRLYVKVLLTTTGAIGTEDPELNAVEIVQLEDEPIEEEGVLHYKLASVGDVVDGRPPLNLFLSGSHICYARSNVLDEKHPFKVKPTGNEVIDGETGEPVAGTSEYEVHFGNAGGIGIPTTLLEVADMNYIYIKFTRDSSSREIIDAELMSGGTLPTSTNTYQYVQIARVNAGDVIQDRFENIRISEFLISEAGELKLISVFDTTNSYTLP